MSSGNLEQFGAYQKAVELFDRVVDDTTQFFTATIKRLTIR